MKSLLVALMVQLLSSSGTPIFNGDPVYVVPVKIIGPNGTTLPLTTTAEFSEADKRKWETVVKGVGGLPVAAELCYRSAYGDLKDGVQTMQVAEQQALLINASGHHGLARVAVRWCNASLRKLDLIPLPHTEFASAERSVREMAYADDMNFLGSCKGEICKKTVASFARGTVGIPLDADK